MDVTLPTGVATVAGTPPAGGVPDVLARLAGTDGAAAPDAFAEQLAALGLGGVDAADGAVPADDDGGADPSATPDATAAALAAEALGLVQQPTVPPIVLTAGGAGGDASAVAAPTGEPGGVGAGAAVAGDTRSTSAASGSAASPADVAAAAGFLAETAEAAHAAPPRQRRAAGSDAAGIPASAKEPASAGVSEHPVAAVTEAVAGSPASPHDAGETEGRVTVDAPARAHEPSPHPHDASLVDTAVEQAKTASRLDTPVSAIDAPSTLLRRREAVPAQPDPAAGVGHATGAESVAPAPRPAAEALPTASSDASSAYRHAAAATLPETNRPLGRLPDGGEMRLEVSPEGLGPIEIRVAVRADAVQASLWAQQDHARAALEAHRPMLADALGRSSLRLEEFTVGVGQHHHAAPDDDHTPRHWANPLAAEPASAPTTTHAPARPRGLSLRA